MSSEYNGTVRLNRKLTDDESKELRSKLDPLFSTQSTEAEDISDFLDYTFAMVSNNKTVEHVIAELVEMDMEFCSQEVANQLGKILSEYLAPLDGAVTTAEEAAPGEDNSNEEAPAAEDNKDEEAKDGSRVVSLKVRCFCVCTYI